MDEFVNQDFGWTEGVSKLYYNLSQDYLYNDPYHHVTFLDNHDLDRFLSQVNGDKEKLKVALGVLLTMRGIPCIFYGTEILMKGKGSHGIIREDFPGGWPNDPINKFDSKNRTAEENDVFNYIQKIQKWKSSNKAFENGKLMQFIPIEGVYVYFRYSDNDAAMIVYNSNKSTQKLNTKRFKEIIKNKISGKEIISDKTIDLNSIEIKSKELMIIDLD
jgi:glycosidase